VDLVEETKNVIIRVLEIGTGRGRPNQDKPGFFGFNDANGVR
jgi:hypothetical protein